jgi:hypothetical protein
VKDVIHLAGVEWRAYVLLQELKVRFVRQMREVLHATREEIVGTHNAVAIRQQCIAQVRSQKSRTTSD